MDDMDDQTGSAIALPHFYSLVDSVGLAIASLHPSLSPPVFVSAPSIPGWPALAPPSLPRPLIHCLSAPTPLPELVSLLSPLLRLALALPPSPSLYLLHSRLASLAYSPTFTRSPFLFLSLPLLHSRPGKPTLLPHSLTLTHSLPSSLSLCLTHLPPFLSLPLPSPL